METINITRHAEKRASQRGITMEQISMCLDFGEKLNRTGVQFYFFSKKCLKKLKKVTGVYMQRLEGLTVMVNTGANGVLKVITVYKNQNALSMIKKKGVFNAN